MTRTGYVHLLARVTAGGLAALAVLAGPQAPSRANPEGAQSASLEGVVTESPGDVPVPDAIITVAGRGPSKSAKTDSNGRYAVTGMAPGVYSVFPRKEGYGRGMSAPPKRVRLTDVQSVAKVDFELHREAVVAGRVLDAEKRPVSGQRVMLWSHGYALGRRTFDLRGSGSTNDLGEFRISGLREGRYYLAAVPEMLRIQNRSNHSLAARKVTEADVRTFYMSSSSPSGAALVVLRGGEQLEGADIVLSRTETYCVTGAVDRTGSERIGLTLTEVADGWSTPIAGGSIGEGQEFEVCGLPRGEYHLLAITTTPDGHLVRLARADFSVSNRDIALGQMALVSPSEMAGHLSITGAESDPPALTGTFIRLLPTDRPAYLNETPEVELKRTGSFLLPHVFTGDYWATFRLPAGFYVKQANCGFGNALREPLRPGCGQLQILLSVDGAALSGRVNEEKDSLPISDATVVLIPAPLPETLAPGVLRTIATDQNGDFEFSSVAPGKYRLLAFAGLRNREAEDPEFVRQWQSKGTEITVQGREQKSVTLSPQRTQ